MVPHGKVVMIRQYRHGIGEVALEIPGGVVDEEDESLAAAAGRVRMAQCTGPGTGFGRGHRSGGIRTR